MPTYSAGESVRIKEVRGSPRPPAQWLGKHGKVRGPVEDWAKTEELSDQGVAPKAIREEPRYLVELEGITGTQSVPASWLVKL